MANTDLSQDDQATTDLAGDGPTSDSSESPTLTAVRGISEALGQMADRAARATAMDMQKLLTDFTNECTPHVKSEALPRHMLTGLTDGLKSVGWNARDNVPVATRSEPPLSRPWVLLPRRRGPPARPLSRNLKRSRGGRTTIAMKNESSGSAVGAAFV